MGIRIGIAGYSLPCILHLPLLTQTSALQESIQHVIKRVTDVEHDVDSISLTDVTGDRKC